jgi:7-cyano-7-deazaguanine synthase
VAKNAVILLSGGIDSTTALAIAKREGYAPFALSFRYGQRHHVELVAAARVAQALGAAEHVVASIDLTVFGGSALTDAIAVPKHRGRSEMQEGIPVTYVPARNTVFLSLALAWCEVLDAEDIFVGVNAVDYSGYPDCRPEYIQAFEAMANLATKAAVEGRQRLRIHAPLMHLHKHEIITTGLALGVDYGLTHSCYDPDPEGRSCGACDSCHIRLEGFRQAGVEDPISYQHGVQQPRSGNETHPRPNATG